MADKNIDADTAKVSEVLDKIVMLTKIQTVYDTYTTPDCAPETLNQLSEINQEKDRSMDNYFGELVALLTSRAVVEPLPK